MAVSPENQLDKRFRCLEKMGEIAAEILLKYFETSMTVEVKGDNSLVTIADKEVQKVLAAEVGKLFPEDLLLSEEGSTRLGEKDSDCFVWIMDPLDGTTNYAKGFPHFCTSIGLGFAGPNGFQMEMALVVEPVRKKVFKARKGHGATVNGVPFKLKSEGWSLNRSVVVTSLFLENERYRNYMEFFSSRCQSVRVPGAAALDLCYLAADTFQIAYFNCARIWDAAAAILILDEAGHEVLLSKRLDPFSSHELEIVAGRPELLKQLPKY